MQSLRSTALHRHDLVRLTTAGWTALLTQAGEGTAQRCIGHWARHDLPLVVARQPAAGRSALLTLGLPAPTCWGRLRLPLSVPRDAIAGVADLPLAVAITPLLPSSLQPAWHRLCEALNACATGVRVYGSYAWQHLSGLDHLRPQSDVDLLIDVSDAQQADAVVALLAFTAPAGPRVDGELRFPDHRSVAWREWAPWRDGREAQLMVKHDQGVALLGDVDSFDAHRVSA